MSQSESDASVETTSSIDIAQRRHSITPSGSRVITPYTYTTSTTDYLHHPQQAQQPQQAALLSRHYATLQDHATATMRAEHAGNNAITLRHEGRRGSFAWALHSARDDETPRSTGNPMMPQRTDNRTPPTMEELVRKNTREDDDSSTRRSSLFQSDTVFSRPSTRRSSTSGTDIDSLTRSDTGKSIGGLARSMTKIIPDIKTHRHSASRAQQSIVVPKLDRQEEAPSSEGYRKSRKLSFQLTSGLRMKGPVEEPQRPSPVEESSKCETPDQAISPDPTNKCVGLAARRLVKMDLTLPIGLPDLFNPKERKGANPAIMSSITPSRPRSPKTPWTRETELDWGRGHKAAIARSAPIIEDDEDMKATDMTTLNNARVELGIESVLSPNRPSLATPAFVRPPQKVRDRCYISRPPARRTRSGGPSTSESDFGSTPDGHWTPGIVQGMTEQEVLAQRELVQLAKTSKTARSRRWPWNKSKASGSDEHIRAKEERSNRNSMTTEVFKRSTRFPETPEKEKKDKKPSKEWNTPWRRSKPLDKTPLPSASLANIPVPPSFVPPGCEKVPTPPMFDAVGEVRGKLADFFFDSNGFNAKIKHKPKASPGGYWDSNAVLMSMHTDLKLSNTEDEEEGPEGRPPAAFHFGPVNDTPGHMASPGFYSGADGYLTVKPAPGVPGASRTSSSPGQNSWFRMHFGEQTPDFELLTAAALKEADERRKFEWLVPEHLPNSPLCPLHVKYVGPSKGLCYWHGRKSNGWGVESGRDYVSRAIRIGEGSSSGWNVGKQGPPHEEKKKKKKKKRRLESFSNP